MAEYILIFRRDVEDFTQSYEQSKAEAIRDIGKKWYEWMADLQNQSKEIQPYKRISKGAKTVHPDGHVTVGPFTEIKECFAGFFMIKADDFNEAVEIAKKCPNLL